MLMLIGWGEEVEKFSLCLLFLKIEMIFSKSYQTDFSSFLTLKRYFPGKTSLFRVRIRDNRKQCEICSKRTLTKPEQRQSLPLDVFIINFGHISCLFLVFPLLTQNR